VRVAVLLCVLPASLAAGCATSETVGTESATDVGLIGYVSPSNGGSPPSIRVIGEDGRIRRTVIRNAKDFDWSPDGRRVAFVRDWASAPCYTCAVLYVANADGTGARRATPDELLDSYVNDFAWAPDSRQIAFSLAHEALCPKGDFELPCPALYVAKANGTAARRVSPPGAGGYGGLDPAWSPNGRQIAYVVHSLRRSEAKIFIVDNDGSRRRRLTRGGVLWELEPTWSPDGISIAFTANRAPNGGFNVGADDVYVIRSDGSRLRRLTNNSRATGEPSTVADDCCPQWSPDGHWLAYRDRQSDFWDVAIMSPDRRAVRRLTKGMDTDHLAWSPDSTRLAFDCSLSAERGSCALEETPYVVAISGGAPRRVAAQGSHLSWSADSRRLVYQTQPELGSKYSVWVMDADGTQKQRLAAGEDPAWKPVR